ncbi:hypothetical protein PSCICO_42510 [Pseudomonas cichorii]|uniref:hypothetical protein n=1 Tax=Pseudomonas cichorii TaxID=36746 RepID=UPI001910AD67|nr:hypothetical protein [Pseudomonas cichorii]GFM88852.1 hypothetical protein PSCICO_42510 [Pseudomonas cichorii]
MYRKTAVALLLMLSSGCSQFPHNRFFTPPAAGPDTAWVRIVGGTERASIEQELNGQRTGGLVRSSEFILTRNQDLGMPVDSEQDKSTWSDYYETPVIAGRKTSIGLSYHGPDNLCSSTMTFVPQKGHYYQFGLQVDVRLRQCRGLPYELIKNEQGQWRLQRQKDVIWGGKYGHEDENWQKMPDSLMPPAVPYEIR